jgi:UDP:flavonoid glycosyltransferase YjiC (YdhE family)
LAGFLHEVAMKITILAHGSRGDIQPFLALAVGLQPAGQRATLVARYNFAQVDCISRLFDPAYTPNKGHEIASEVTNAGGKRKYVDHPF